MRRYSTRPSSSGIVLLLTTVSGMVLSHCMTQLYSISAMSKFTLRLTYAHIHTRHIHTHTHTRTHIHTHTHDAGELEGLIIQLASVISTKKRLFVHVFLVPHALTHTNRRPYKASSSCAAIVDGPPMLSRAVTSRAFITRGTGVGVHMWSLMEKYKFCLEDKFCYADVCETLWNV